MSVLVCMWWDLALVFLSPFLAVSLRYFSSAFVVLSVALSAR